MKEHPIIFNGEMVRAILDGRKTQTRRVINFVLNIPHVTGNPPDRLYGDWALSEIGELKDGVLGYRCQTDVDDYRSYNIKCPYGVPGDHLWVRETWQYLEELEKPEFVYRATDWEGWLEYEVEPIRWKPSIFMPRRASRITLEVTAVRVERVQDITWQDILAEGIHSGTAMGVPYPENPTWIENVIGEFASLWDSINAARGYSWESNPWVWVVDFKVVQ